MLYVNLGKRRLAFCIERSSYVDRCSFYYSLVEYYAHRGELLRGDVEKMRIGVPKIGMRRIANAGVRRNLVRMRHCKLLARLAFPVSNRYDDQRKYVFHPVRS